MRVLYGLCSWGLGHATRSLPIIRKLIEDGNEVTILTTGPSLELLRMELKDEARYIDFPDYPLPYTEKSKVFLIKFCLYSPRLIQSIINEHRKILKLVERNKFDTIISNHRYGVFHRGTPSFLMTHQLRIIAPRRIRLIENSFEKFTMHFQKYFRKIMVPDYEDDGLSGDLAHNLNRVDISNVVYIGILSDFKRMDVACDVDFLFSISGPEPQRQVMEDLIIQQINDVSGNIILSLGRKLNGDKKRIRKNLNENIRIYGFLPAEQRELIMNRSKFIISRSGYSTLMDIYALGKKAMFIPTPQQTEQEYLAKYHEEKGNFLYVDQDEIALTKDLEKAKDYHRLGRKGDETKYDVKKSTERFMEVIYG